MITRMNLQVDIKDADYSSMVSRYHFHPEDTGQLKTYVQALLPLLQCRAYYRREGTKVIAFVTLGDGVDRLQDLYEEKGALSESYILECVGLQLLMNSYVAFVKELQQETGCFAKSLEFFGDRYPLEDMEHHYRRMCADAEFAEAIRYSGGELLKPLKTVAMVIPLGAEAPDRNPCDLCAACGNVDCIFRMNRFLSDESMRPDRLRLEHMRKRRKEQLKSMKDMNSYAYQRFFGTEE